MTPFDKAGYTKNTKFKVLRDLFRLKKGDIVTLELDDGSKCPIFKTEDGNWGSMWLPNMALDGEPEELEVYEEPNKELTPFEEAGYTDTTKFRVLRKTGILNKDDIVTLKEDDGSTSPVFNKRDLRLNWMYLPGMAAREGKPEELEVYEEPKPDPKKYEYSIENYTHELLTTEELLDNLNKEGINGWELCGTVGSKFIYKREV